MSNEFVPITIAYDCTALEHAEAQLYLTRAANPQAAETRPATVSALSPRAALTRGLMGWVLFIGLAVMLFTLLNEGSGPFPLGELMDWLGFAKPVPRDIFVAFGGFTLSVMMLATSSLLFRRARYAPQRWHGQSRYTFDANAVVFDRPGRQDRFAWEKFLKLGETENLLLLHIDAKQAIILPKRLFAGGSEIDRLRQLAQRQLLRPAIPQAHGFPVVAP